jgi:hypothetical protein
MGDTMIRKIFLYVKAYPDLGTFMDLIAINVLMYVATGSSAWLRPWRSGLWRRFIQFIYPQLLSYPFSSNPFENKKLPKDGSFHDIA